MSIHYSLRVNSNKLEQFYDICQSIDRQCNTFYNHSRPFQYIVENFLKNPTVNKRTINKCLSLKYPKDIQADICIDDRYFIKFEEICDKSKIKKSAMLTYLMYKFIDENNSQ